MSKNLKEKAIKIQGKDYVLVSDRILYFNDTYENWCITTEIVEMQDKEVHVKATVIPDVANPARFFTGHSQEVNDGKNFINKTSMLENAETSAVGRALAMMWIWVIDSIASVDEIKKATNRTSDKEENNLPRFNDEQYEKMKEAIVAGKLEVSTAEEATKMIRSKYKLSKAMQAKVEDLFKTKQWE